MVIRRAWVLLVMLGLGACGFQLRGNAALPFESVYIEGGQDIVVDLERAIRFYSAV